MIRRWILRLTSQPPNLPYPIQIAYVVYKLGARRRGTLRDIPWAACESKMEMIEKEEAKTKRHK